MPQGKVVRTFELDAKVVEYIDDLAKRSSVAPSEVLEVLVSQLMKYEVKLKRPPQA